MEKQKANRAHLFNKSPYFDKDKLTIALFGTKYQEADIDYYHEKADIWSNKGKGNKKIDWLATLKNWMHEALNDGKLVYKKHAEMDKEIKQVAEQITAALTSWSKEEETQVKQAPQPQQAAQMEIPTDWSQHWADLQEKARRGIRMIIALPVYQWLEDTGQLELSKDEKIDLFMEAKFAYISELEASFTPQDKEILKIMKTEDWGNCQPLLERVRSRAKILAVRQHLHKSIQPQKKINNHA